MLYKICVWTLLTIVPLTGLRMICVDPPTAEMANAAQATEAGEDCRDTCPLPKKTKPRSDGPLCMLLADSCSLLLAGVVAVLPSSPTMGLELQSSPIADLGPEIYLSPAPAALGPPPKA